MTEYAVRFYLNGVDKGGMPYSGDFRGVVHFAKASMVRHEVDAARIIQKDTGVEVEFLKRDA